jgi:hypothetical protein
MSRTGGAQGGQQPTMISLCAILGWRPRRSGGIGRRASLRG